MVCALAAMALLIAAPLFAAFHSGFIQHREQHMAAFALGIAAMVVVMLALVITMAVVNVFTKDFVVPQMALENIGAFEGWRRLFRQVDTERGSYAGYVGMKIVLAIAAAILTGIASLIIVVPIIIVAVIVAVLVAIVAKPVGLAWTAATIALAIAIGIPLLLLLIYAVAVIASPVTVFFPAYAIYFFADRYPPLGRIVFPPPPPPPAPPEPPPIVEPPIEPAPAY